MVSRKELIAGLEALARRTADNARFQRAGAAALMDKYEQLREERPATKENHIRLLELFPMTIGAERIASEDEEAITLLGQAIEELRNESQNNPPNPESEDRKLATDN